MPGNDRGDPTLTQSALCIRLRRAHRRRGIFYIESGLPSLLGIVDLPAFSRAVECRYSAVDDRFSALLALPRNAGLGAGFHGLEPWNATGRLTLMRCFEDFSQDRRHQGTTRRLAQGAAVARPVTAGAPPTVCAEKRRDARGPSSAIFIGGARQAAIRLKSKSSMQTWQLKAITGNITVIHLFGFSTYRGILPS